MNNECRMKWRDEKRKAIKNQQQQQQNAANNAVTVTSSMFESQWRLFSYSVSLSFAFSLFFIITTDFFLKLRRIQGTETN